MISLHGEQEFGGQRFLLGSGSARLGYRKNRRETELYD